MTMFVLHALYLCGFANCAFQRREFLEELFSDYEITFPPRRNLTEDIEVTIGASIASIDFVSEIEQYLEATLRLNIAWDDHFLKWNVTESDIPKYFVTSRRSLWTPRIIVPNTAGEEWNIIEDDDPILVFQKGLVIWTKFIHTKTACKINIQQFPFDRQVCRIKFGPTLQKFSYFNLKLNESFGYIAAYTESNEWHLTSTKQLLGENNVDREMGEVVVEIVLNRRYVFHIFKGILPPVCLSLMNCFVFRLPAGDGERITMSISVLLSYTLYLSFINESLPENSDTVCIFSVYLSCLLILSTLIILATIYSISLHQHDDGGTTIHRNQVGCNFEEMSKFRWMKTAISLHQNVENCNGQTQAEKIDKNQAGSEIRPKTKWLRNAKTYDNVVFWIFLGTTLIVSGICLFLMTCNA